MSSKIINDGTLRGKPAGPRFGAAKLVSINALRTLRRMFHKAEDGGLLRGVPQFKLVKEFGRTRRLDEEAEERLLVVAGQPLRDIIILMRDTGDLDWKSQSIFISDSKTQSSRRHVPMSGRVLESLMVTCAGRQEGWVFPARSRSGHITSVDKQAV